MKLSDCHNVADFRRLAKRRLPYPVFHYIDGAADDEGTKARNTAAFDDVDLVPNVLAGSEEIDMGITLMGRRIAMPLFLSPTALQRLFHWEGERAVARADVALVTGSNTTENHPVAATFIKQAAKAGTDLIVVDVRRNPIADVARHFAQIRPGTDVAFYNALMYVILDEGLADLDYVSRHTENFEALQARRQPGVEQRLRLHRLHIGFHPLLDLGHQGGLHRGHVGQAQELARLFRRAIDIDGDLHRVSPLSAGSLGWLGSVRTPGPYPTHFACCPGLPTLTLFDPRTLRGPMTPADDPAPAPRNLLDQETSPYLLQHAHNPVDWYPWSDEALAHQLLPLIGRVPLSRPLQPPFPLVPVLRWIESAWSWHSTAQ